MFVVKEVTLCLDDPDHPSFQAWVNEDKIKEDGACVPYFMWDTASNIMRTFEKSDCSPVGYDFTHDMFVIKLPSDDEVSRFSPEIIEINGVKSSLYPIGKDKWTWKIKK